MILGIVALPFALCCSLVGVAIGIVAAVLGFLGKNKADQGQASNRGQAMAGLICGVIAVVLGLVMFFLGLAMDWDRFNTNI
jgi:hypothetical protein